MVAIQANAEADRPVPDEGRLRVLTPDSPVVIDLTGERAVIEVGGITVPVEARQVGRGRRIVTRVFDLSLALPAAIVATPLMAVIAVAVRMTSKGPALFASERLTRDGQPFKMLKFRSMVTNGDEVLAAHFAAHPEAELEFEMYHKLVDDPRVTRLGRFLRRSNLDELPQLYNVVSGRMSVVGPRPTMEYERDLFGAAFPAVCQVKSGLTGRWQVSGRSNLTFDERIAHDVMYVADRTLVEDVRIIAKTVQQMVKGDSGAY